jgi:mannan endo-1,4-beta-mannosidase
MTGFSYLMRFEMRIIICIILLSSFTRTRAQTVEAEQGILSGTQIANQRAGYTGSGYITGFDADGDKVTMKVDVSQSGIYKLNIRYAAPSGEKFNFVYVNDQNLGSVQFAASNVFRETLVGKIFLNQGENTIAIVKEWGYFELDNIRLEPSQASPINPIASALVTSDPSAKTSALYGFLSKTYGKAILSGQYGGEVELNRIQSVSGKSPLMRGFDMIDYSPTRVEHGTSSTEVEKAMTWHGLKGIVTFAWHWNAPKDLIDQPGKEWWRGFYTDATTFDVSKAMNDNASEEYTLILRDIDAIAVQLKKLKDADVPVLWRPLHEAEGKWFWWGAKGPEACKWLWKLVFDRLVNHHQLNNLIWVWTSTGSPSAAEWYPGDDCVDIIGADIYLPAGTYSSNFITFDNMASLYGGKKIITLSENGPIPDPDRLFVERADWNWFCTWSGDFITDGVSNSTSHINKVFNHEYVITLDELENVDNIIAELEEKRKALDEDDDGEVLGVEDFTSLGFSYQNPIRNNKLILLSKGSQSISNVIIYDVRGEIVASKENHERSARLEFNFEEKNAGLYLVKITTAGTAKVIRVIKK